MIGTSYIPSVPWALLFGFVPLWIHATNSQQKLSKIFLMGWWTQFILTAIGFHWVAYVSHEFGFLPWPIAILVLFVFSGLVHLYIPVALTISIWLKRRWNLSIPFVLFIIALTQVLGEMYWPRLFPWNLGYPWLWIQSPIAQTADIWGFEGLSVFAHLINALIALAVLIKTLRIRVTMAVSIALIALVVLGNFQQSQWTDPDRELKVLQIQANIGNFEKYYAERGAGYQQYIADIYFNLTRQSLAMHPDADLIVWPESGFPDYLNEHRRDRRYPMEFFDFLREIKKPILTGAYSEDPPSAARRGEYNALFLFNAQAELLGQYHKTNLLAFGEFTPLVDVFPWLEKISPAGRGFGRGSGAITLNWSQRNEIIKIGPQICYDSLYPSFSTALTHQGSQILVNLTNDSWFGPSFEPQQHLIMTLARAIEVRRPLIRNTNTGITTAIGADGQRYDQSPLYKSWAGVFNIKYYSQPPLTFYSRFQAWLAPLVLLILLGLIWEAKRRARPQAS